MEKSVKERLQVQILIEIGIFFVFYKLFLNESIYKLLYNIIDIFNIHHSAILANIIVVLLFLIIYIISININFHNVKFLTKEYINKYIFKIITVNLFIFLFVPFIVLIFSKSLDGLYKLALLLFILIVLKIFYTIIYFKIKSKKFISEEEYIKEQQKKMLAKQMSIVDEENKKTYFKNLCSIITLINFLIFIISLVLILSSGTFDIDIDLGTLLTVNIFSFLTYAIGTLITITLTIKK